MQIHTNIMLQYFHVAFELPTTYLASVQRATKLQSSLHSFLHSMLRLSCCQLRSLHSAMVQEKCTSLESVISKKEKEKRKCCTLVGGLESYGHGNRMKCLKRVQAAQCGVIRCAHAVFCVASSIFSPWLQKKYMERTPLETLYRFRSRRGLREFEGRSSRVF